MSKVLLIVLDGYGEGKNYKWNAVTKSKTPFLDSIRKKYPKTILKCSGNDVGLPKGAMGGSEVGHFTIGAGRIVYQSLEEINRSIKKGDFFKLKKLKEAATYCRKTGAKFHILGMISDQGIHSHLNHLFALLKFAKHEKLKNICIHAITDGRDVPEKSAAKYIKIVEKEIKKLGLGKIVNLIGRYYAMDRDKNYETRTQKAYDLYTLGKGSKEQDPEAAIKKQYKQGVETDYYIKPISLDKEGIIRNKDAVVFYNFRSDRAIQITRAFTEKDFKDFPRKKKILPRFVCFGPYSDIAPVLFAPNEVKNNLSRVLSRVGKTQLRIAETDKYGHVTFFFNSQVKKAYRSERWVLIPSPKVPSYADTPEMSAKKITKRLIKEFRGSPDFIVCNFANCDLVGHSGDFKATVKGVETVDECLKDLVPAALEEDYKIILTADHGNAEWMRYDNGDPCPSHSFNPVMCALITNDKYKLRKTKNLGLQDIAPTILDLMKVKKPREMTGKSLIKK